MADNDFDPHCLLEAFGDITPVKSQPPDGIKEHRDHIRYAVSWRIAISARGQNWQVGKIRDISLNGAAIKLEHSIKPGTHIALNIQVPALDPSSAPKILVIYGKVSHSVFDSRSQDFRIGIAFTRFEPASDQAYLGARLSKHQTRAL